MPKDGYANPEWFLDIINNRCNCCRCELDIDIKGGNAMRNKTCQRKDNELTHTLDYIVPY